MVTGSPSRCAGPSLCRYITADGALKVCIMVFELMYPVNRSIPTRAVSNGVPAWMIVMSSSPSVMLAVGAIYALLPYCDALQHAIRNAFFGKNVPVGTYCIYLRMEFDVFRDCAFYVGEFSSTMLSGEIAAYGGIESHAESAEERHVINCAVVALHDVIFGYDLDRAQRVEGYSEVSCKTVARPAGDDAQCRVAVTQCRCRFVDRSVATGGDYSIEACVNGVPARRVASPWAQV